LLPAGIETFNRLGLSGSGVVLFQGMDFRVEKILNATY